MFIGHYGPAFAARSVRSAPRFATLFVAAQLVDIAFFTFVPLGIEKLRILPGITASNPMDLYYMPWTHSLAGAAVWAVLFAGLVTVLHRRTGSGARTAFWLIAAVVLSHWLLDLIVHRPDLTIGGSPPKLGLGLWNDPALERPLEWLVLLGGAALYARARPDVPRWRLFVLLAVMVVLQCVNWFGPPPDNIGPGFWGLALFAYGLCVAGAWWVERGVRP